MLPAFGTTFCGNQGPRPVVDCIWQCTDGKVVVVVVVEFELVWHSRSTSSLHLPFGLRCSNIVSAGLNNGRVVIIPYLCISTYATVMSSLRLTGRARLWVKKEFLFFGVNFTSKMLLIPLSCRCLSEISLYSTMVDADCLFSLSYRKEFFQFNI